MKLHLTLLALFFCLLVQGQELSNIGKSPLLQVNGGLSVNQVFSWSDLPGSYNQPYAYTLAANMNFAIYGWSIPLSGMFSNKRWSYQQPFNQFSLSPSYKWARIYLGYNSMSFSNYTLNGHRFLGAGVELTPSGNWKFSAMAGRMQKRILPDTTGNVIPAYNRFGTGFKTEYSFTGGNIALSTFYASDNASSLKGYDSIPVTPAENLALTLGGNVSLIPNIILSAEYSTSIFTEDTYAFRSEDQYKIIPVYNKRTSTHRYYAVKSNLAYNSPIGSIGLGYERVEPGFQTLGSYNTVNDFINYTFNYAGQVIPEKVTLASSIGLQQDDIENVKAQKNQRWVGSVNVGFTPVKAVNASINYGNFRNYTHIRTGFEDINNITPYPDADTLDYTQISENMGLSVSVTPTASENVTRSIIVSTNFQQATEQQSDDLNHARNIFVNGMLGYSQSMKKQNLTLSSGINFNHNKADTIITITVGPSVSARKMFFDKKMNTNLSVAYNQSFMNNKSQSEVYVVRAGIGYTLKEKHFFDLSNVFANRHSLTRKTYNNDLSITLTYRYNFKAKPIDIRKKKLEDNK